MGGWYTYGVATCVTCVRDTSGTLQHEAVVLSQVSTLIPSRQRLRAVMLILCVHICNMWQLLGQADVLLYVLAALMQYTVVFCDICACYTSFNTLSSEA
jgi:hypothetical protein